MSSIIHKVFDRVRYEASNIRFGKNEDWRPYVLEHFDITPEQMEAYAALKPRKVSEFNDSYLGQAWAERVVDRSDPDDLNAFWADIGTGQACRQSFFRHENHFPHIHSLMKPDARVCEYGAGVAPVSFWLTQKFKGPLHFTLVDVPSKHTEFGEWRLRRLSEKRERGSTVRRIIVEGNSPPSLGEKFDVIIIVDVLEHLTNPVEIITHLLSNLKVGGYLVFNYIEDQDALNDTPLNPTNTASAVRQREQVFELCAKHAELDNRYFDDVVWKLSQEIETT